MSHALEIQPTDFALPTVTQDWAAYDASAHEAWRRLYAGRMETLTATGSEVFLRGAQTIGLASHQVPDLRDVNALLAPLTGWRAVPVRGFIPAHEFFASLAERRFPTTVTVRPLAQLDYLPEPDIFHDVFGHVPLHADPVFADFLQRFGAVAARATRAEDVERMARLFWFTVEFGLVREGGSLKVYGSGLISSAKDAANALSDRCERHPFELDAVLSQPFEIDDLQPVLFVIDSFEQLFDAVSRVADRIC